MKHEQGRWRIQLYYYSLAGLFALSMLLPAWSLRDNGSSRWVDELRILKTKRLEMARAVDVLKDNLSVVNNLRDKSFTVESLTVSLIEAVRQQSQKMDIKVPTLSVVDSKEAKLLRVEFTALLQESMQLLALFDAIRTVADWRHLEVRGCTILKEQRESILHSACVVDVHYFIETDA